MTAPSPFSSFSPLDPQLLRHCCAPEQFKFETTAELEDLTEIIGQARAMDALHFGVSIRHEGYNLFVLGPPGMGKRSAVRQFLEKKPVKHAKRTIGATSTTLLNHTGPAHSGFLREEARNCAKTWRSW